MRWGKQVQMPEETSRFVGGVAAASADWTTNVDGSLPHVCMPCKRRAGVSNADPHAPTPPASLSNDGEALSSVLFVLQVPDFLI